MSNSMLTSYDPWDASPVGEFVVATPVEIDKACRRCRVAGKTWSRDPGLRRQVILALAEQLKTHRDELARLISRETGKVLWESLLEVDAMVNKCALSIRAEDERRAPTSKAAPGAGGLLATTYRPHGIVLVIGPFNFPGHLPLGHIIPALLAGNTVLFKPSEKAPAVAEYIATLFQAAGLPKWVLHVLHGRGDVAAQIIKYPIDAVLFTGSYNVGTKILTQLASRPGVLTALEMGGNNPLIAWDISPNNIPATVLTILQSAFATAGQRCSCARRLILPNDSPILPALTIAMAQLRFGHPTDPAQPFYGTLIDSAAVDGVLTKYDALLADGATGLLAPARSSASPALLSPGLVDVTSSRSNWNDDTETFGPLLKVIRAPTFEGAIDLANLTQYGLASGLLTDNPALWDAFRLEARAGLLTLNRPTTGASSELPFGGVGNSGNHRPSAYHAADYASYPVAEMSTTKLQLPDKLPPGLTL